MVTKAEGKSHIGRPKRRWEDNIKMNFQKVGLDWSKLVQERDRWREFVDGVVNLQGKSKVHRCTGTETLYRPVEDPRFQDNRHTKVVRLSALRTGRLYTPGNNPGTNFC